MGMIEAVKLPPSDVAEHSGVAQHERDVSSRRVEHALEIGINSNRRAFLGTAALGAGGLVALANGALAEGATDKGKPGEGGFAREAQQLPTGARVAYHDPKDVGAKFSRGKRGRAVTATQV